MIPLDTWLLFCLACVALAATPGPNMLFLVSRTLAQGRGRGLRVARRHIERIRAPRARGGVRPVGAARRGAARVRRRALGRRDLPRVARDADVAYERRARSGGRCAACNPARDVSARAAHRRAESEGRGVPARALSAVRRPRARQRAAAKPRARVDPARDRRRRRFGVRRRGHRCAALVRAHARAGSAGRSVRSPACSPRSPRASRSSRAAKPGDGPAPNAADRRAAQIRDTLRAFARDELAPNAAAWDREHTFPRDALRALGALGALGIVVPEHWGGAGLDYVSLAVALEEIAAGDGATSTIVSVQNSVVCGPINAFGTDAQKDALSAVARARRAARLLLPDRAAGRLRCGRDRDARRARRRSLRAERRQAVHHDRRERRRRDRVRA